MSKDRFGLGHPMSTATPHGYRAFEPRAPKRRPWHLWAACVWSPRHGRHLAVKYYISSQRCDEHIKQLIVADREAGGVRNYYTRLAARDV